MLETTPNDLRELLQASIKLIKQHKPYLSSSALAVNLNMACSTLGRIENGEVKKPDFNSAIAILKAAHGDEKAKQFAQSFYPELVENFEKIYKGNQHVPFVDVDAEKYFRDSTSYELMVMATSEAGINREAVKAEYGNKGLSILDELLEKEVLIDNDGVIGIKGNINARQGTVHQLVQNLIAQNYDLPAFGKKNNWLSLQYDSVDLDKALPKLREIMEKANSEIRALLNDPTYKGKDVMWAAMAADSLKKQGSQKEVLQ